MRYVVWHQGNHEVTEEELKGMLPDGATIAYHGQPNFFEVDTSDISKLRDAINSSHKTVNRCKWFIRLKSYRLYKKP